jgi:hypothetical protein
VKNNYTMIEGHFDFFDWAAVQGERSDCRTLRSRNFARTSECKGARARDEGYAVVYCKGTTTSDVSTADMSCVILQLVAAVLLGLLCYGTLSGSIFPVFR